MNLTFSGVLVLAALAGTLAQAQEPAADDADVLPTAEFADAPAPTVPSPEQRAEEIDDLEPGVPSQVLVSEVREGPSRSGVVMDELDLGRTEITGNQELPTVLYIVPWQKSDPGDLMGRPANTLLDEILAPVDRGEFVRQVDYYGDLFESKEEQ